MSCLLCAVLFSVGAKIFPADLNAGEKSVWENTYLHRRTIDNPKNKSKPTTTAEHSLSSLPANGMILIPSEKGQGSFF